MSSSALVASPAMDRLFQAAASGNVALDGVPEELYHAFPAMSATGLKEFRKGPHYFDYWRKNPSSDTQARLEGRLVHMALGEPERFARTVVSVDGVRSRTDVKERVAIFRDQGLTVCKPDDLKMATEVAAFCRRHPLIAKILETGVAERTLLWKDPATGVQCKARVDWMTAHGAMCDWKCFDPIYDEDAIEKQVRYMRYHFQAEWYLRGFAAVYRRQAKAFYNVFIRTDHPRDAVVREISSHSIEEARMRIDNLLPQYAECVAKDLWVPDQPEVLEIVVAPWGY